MDESTTVVSQKRRGPVPTGKGTPIMVRLQPEILAQLDNHIGQDCSDSSRPEAIRAILTDWLGNRGFLPK
jgi:hypothetical protein